ncbi:hypothetical protein QQF64_020014 [Cirrhinus molitorella]|uniref:Uncharacterized protein n=1 Tax=Cirrhinus molitorella TaxID=172907 RepID=A0ABR3LHA8_9TELE
MYGYKAYPSDKEIAMVAEALVVKYPCLKEAGSQTGWNGWKNSLKFKMGNYRSKMRRAGSPEITLRQNIVDEMKKAEKNLPLIQKMMQTTFALQRQTIVKTCPPVKELMELWPALKMESEFQRITNQNLPNTFYSELDRHLPRLMTLFRQKASRTGKT